MVLQPGHWLHCACSPSAASWVTGYGVRGLASPHPLLGCHQVRGAHRFLLWTSLLFCSSSSCIPTRTWRCLNFRSSTECSNFQLCFRGVYAQCKLCKSWSFHRAVLRRCLRALCCALTSAGDGLDSAENREVSARVLGQGCLARCDARQGVVQTVQKTVKIPHAFLDMVLARRCCNDRCRACRDSAENCGVSAVGAAPLRFLRCLGLRAILATTTLLRRASLCRVSRGVWRKVSNPEVLRLLFCERRMRCGFVWCSSYSSQWTG